MKAILKYRICVLLIALGMIPVVSAQTYQDDQEEIDGNGIVLQGENLTPTMLANLGLFNTPNPKNATIEGNAVQLRQIGDYNIANIRTRTNASEINLLQNGDSNKTEIDYTANTAVADLVQNGSYNQIRDYVNNPDADISLDLIQNGNGLNFERDGVNELTKSLKFRQTEASPTIVVRSLF